MKLILIFLLSFFILYGDEDYEKAHKYLEGKIGTKIYIKKVHSLYECGEDIEKNIECIEDFQERNKKYSYKVEKKINYQKALKYLEKSFEKGNDKAGEEIVDLINRKKDLQNKVKLKEKVLKKLLLHDNCYANYLKADEQLKNNPIKAYISFEKVLKLCKKNSLQYSIAKRKIELITLKQREKSFWQWLIFWLKYFWYKFF